MRSYKPRRPTTGINIPRCADIQDCAIGCSERTIHSVPGAVLCRLRLNHFIFFHMVEQRLGQLPPIGSTKAEANEERSFAAARGMSRIQQVVYDLLLGDGGRLAPGTFISHQVHFTGTFGRGGGNRRRGVGRNPFCRKQASRWGGGAKLRVES